MRPYLFICLFIGICCLNACLNADSYPPEPAITEISLNKTSIGNLTDRFVITLQFQDGDGNLGTTEDMPAANVFVVDKRDQFVTNYSFADVSGGLEQAISGTIDITIESECCRVLSGIPCQPNANYPPTDTVQYDVIIKDRAGNLSNVKTTPPLVIVCE